MRDMNQELLNNPFDEELQAITGPFGGLLLKIVETIDQHGLKRRYLEKHEPEVAEFFKPLMTLRQEARERRIISKCETFHRNPAGNQAVRQSRASSRKRVLRGGGRPSPRSVDSEIKRCVIEPRNFLVVSLRLGQSRGPRQALATLGPTSVPGHTGVGGTLANDHRGFTGTWETLPSPSYLPAGEPG